MVNMVPQPHGTLRTHLSVGMMLMLINTEMGIVDYISQEKEKWQWKFFPTPSEKRKGEAKAEYFHGQYCISTISL